MRCSPEDVKGLIVDRLTMYAECFAPDSDRTADIAGGLFRADCVAKVESCRATNFHQNINREKIADSYSLTLITEVACEFNVRR